jgi:membrane fusion protein, heavy metal efflux system
MKYVWIQFSAAHNGFACALLSVLCIACFTACSRQAASAESAPTASEPKPAKDEVVVPPDQQAEAKIETSPAVLSSQPDYLRVKGVIAIDDSRTWKLGVRTIGSVTHVYAGLGDHVTKGQILARFHADEVRDTRALYRVAVSERERASSEAAQAQRSLDRAKRLLELKAGSVQQVELAQQDLVSAQAAVKRADIEVDRTKDLLEDDLKVPAEPTPNRADETEDEVPIIAPSDGFVLEKNVTPGKTVELDTVTFAIGDLADVWMLASIRQEDLAKLRMGQHAYVVLDPATRLSGTITNLGQQFDPATRMMQVRIELANPQNRLRPQMLADAEIPVGGGKPVLMVSSDAIQPIDGQDVVFVRTSPERFSVRPVTTGETADGKTPILEGLKPGEQVVVRGSFVLKSQLLKASVESD